MNPQNAQTAGGKAARTGRSSQQASHEREVSALNGWMMLAVNLAILGIGVFLFARSIYETAELGFDFPVVKFIASLLIQTLAVILLIGHFTLQPNRAAHFGAPWGKTVVITTAAVLPLIASACLIPISLATKSEDKWIIWFGPLLLIVALGIPILLYIRGYVLDGDELHIRRLGWQTTLSLTDLRNAHHDAKAMERSLRMAGNGGLFGITGWFRNKKLGRYRAFVTDPKRSVVLEFEDKKIVVSPDKPKRFVEALNLPAPGSDPGKRSS